MEGEESQSLLNRRESRDYCIKCCKSCCVGCVCSKGILLLLTWSVLIHSFGYYLVYSFISEHTYYYYYYFIAILGLYAVVLFLYPIAGLLAEVCFSRYRLMIGGTILALIIAVPTATVAVHNHSQFVPVCVGLVIHWLGLGLFAIQFGTDQLQFASAECVY